MRNRISEKGNALFLILIAVVLFAALSYAITQSNRGSGSTGREKNMITGTVITEFASSVKVGTMRLMIRNVAPSSLVFLGPSDGAYGGVDKENEILHPDGGGVSFVPMSPDMVDTVIPTTTRSTQNWYLVPDKVVESMGSSTGDIVLLLSDVKETVCRRINDLIVGDTAIPTTIETEASLLSAGGTISDAGSTLNTRAFFCVKPSDNDHYIYYHVLAEQ